MVLEQFGVCRQVRDEFFVSDRLWDCRTKAGQSSRRVVCGNIVVGWRIMQEHGEEDGSDFAKNRFFAGFLIRDWLYGVSASVVKGANTVLSDVVQPGLEQSIGVYWSSTPY